MKYVLLILGISLLTLFSVSAYLPVLAIDMNSASYSIKFGNLNFGSGKETSASYTLTNTMGQLAAQRFASAGYIVKAGFQYIYPFTPFSFTVSKRILSLGSLTPNVFSSDSTTLTITNTTANGYQVSAITKTALNTITGNSIPRTNCDSGCTISSSGTWNTATNNGWGYSMSGTDIPTDFTTGTKYRPFANTTLGESPITVMSSANVGKNKQSIMVITASVAGTQPSGQYFTVINFVATPKY